EHPEVGAHRPRQYADDLLPTHWRGVGNLIDAVPPHRAVPGTVRIVAAIGRQERELVAGTAQRQATISGPIRQLDIGEHDRRQDRLTPEVRSHQPAYRAVRTVGADQIPCPPKGSTPSG